MISTKLGIIDKNEWSSESNTLGWFPSITVSTTDASKYRMRAAGHCLRSIISIFRMQKVNCHRDLNEMIALVCKNDHRLKALKAYHQKSFFKDNEHDCSPDGNEKSKWMKMYLHLYLHQMKRQKRNWRCGRQCSCAIGFFKSSKLCYYLN